MPDNSMLISAHKNKNDEFFTRIDEIYKEVCTFENDRFIPKPVYADEFRNKTVLCNCNDTHSDFRKFFQNMSTVLGLKELITVSYGEQAEVITETENGTQHLPLKGDGSFLSDEGLNLIEKADIIVTNPPFSLMGAFLLTMFRYDKKFLLFGNITALGQRSIFPYFMDGKVWLGQSIHSGDRPFYIPDGYTLKAETCGLDEDGSRYIRVKGVRWFTNLGEPQYPPPMRLKEWDEYNSRRYQEFLNYNAINVSSTSDIPHGYDGKMGVPLTFLDKYNPEQFELIGLDVRVSDDKKALRVWEKGKEKNLYTRIIIRERR